MHGRLVYNEEHMVKISKMYIECAVIIEDAYRSVESAGNNLSAYYKGGGEMLFNETVQAVYSHLKLLESCARALSKYVDSSYATMKSQDESRARDLGRTSSHHTAH